MNSFSPTLTHSPTLLRRPPFRAVDDVVERFEPTWMRDWFIREASWAHHYSVIARIKMILRLDICERIEGVRQRTLVVYGQHDNL